MTETGPTQPPLDDPQFISLIGEHDAEGVDASGAIPEGHEGPYMPTVDELVEGIRSATKATIQLYEGRTELAADRVIQLLQEEATEPK